MSWLLFFKNVALSILALSGVAFIVWHSFLLHAQGKKAHRIAVFSAGWCTLLTLGVSLRLILQHFSHWVYPKQQKFVVRIIAIVPVYALESYLALSNRKFAIYIETLRECYEAYAIYSFLYFLISLFGEEVELLKILRNKGGRGQHMWPLSLFVAPWTSGHEILTKCKLGVLQYVVVKNVSAIFVFILASRNLYDDGKFQLAGVNLWICMINSSSQLCALYSLIKFYFATREELAPWRPVAKFVLIKSVVFATWYQSVVVSMISHKTNLIADHKGLSPWTDEEVAKGIQDYSICIEMLIASFFFNFAFTYKDYHATGRATVMQRSNQHSRDSNDNIGDEVAVIAATEEDDDLHQDRKPFLTAVWQSSVPSDFLAEFRSTVWSKDRKGSPVQSPKRPLVGGEGPGGDLEDERGDDE